MRGSVVSILVMGALMVSAHAAPITATLAVSGNESGTTDVSTEAFDLADGEILAVYSYGEFNSTVSIGFGALTAVTPVYETQDSGVLDITYFINDSGGTVNSGLTIDRSGSGDRGFFGVILTGVNLAAPVLDSDFSQEPDPGTGGSLAITTEAFGGNDLFLGLAFSGTGGGEIAIPTGTSQLGAAVDGTSSMGLLAETLGDGGALSGSYEFSNSGNQFRVQQGYVVWRAVPEPATLALLALGGVAMFLRRRR